MAVRRKAGTLLADPETFPPKDPTQVWQANRHVGWQDAGTPVVIPGCFPWLPPEFDIRKERSAMFPDRAAICKINREMHLKAGVSRSVTEFFPGGPMAGLQGKKVIVCGSGPSLGKERASVERARADGIPVVVVNGAIAAIPNADVFFCLERCAKAEWWPTVDPATTPLWCSLSAHYSLCEKWPADRRFYFWHHWDTFDGFAGAPELVWRFPPTLSCMVSTLNCLNLLAFCGVAEIWLLGQDFAGLCVWDAKTQGWAPGPYYWDGSFPADLAGEPAALDRSSDNGVCATTARLSAMAKATEVVAQLLEENAGIKVYNVGNFGVMNVPSTPEWKKYQEGGGGNV